MERWAAIRKKLTEIGLGGGQIVFKCMGLFFLLLPSRDSIACSCAFPESAYKSYSYAKSIFVGKVLKDSIINFTFADDGLQEIDVNAEDIDTLVVTTQRLIEFEVRQIYKGKLQGTITIRTPIQNSECRFNFKTGGNYIVYAYDDGWISNYLLTDRCTATSKLTMNKMKELNNAIKKTQK